MKTLTAMQIINTRDSLTHTINSDWKKIQLENCIYKNETRNYVPKALLSSIMKMSDERVTYKLYAQAINMGYTNFSEFPAASIYKTIFEISEINAQIVQLGLIPTIAPKLKRAKGKANLTKKEELTSAFITKTINDLSKKKLLLEKQRDEYNSKAVLIIDDSSTKELAA